MKKYMLPSLIFVVGLGLGIGGTVIYKENQELKDPLQLMEDFPRSVSGKSLDRFYDNFFDDDFFKGNSFPFRQMEKMREDMDSLLRENQEDFPSDGIFDDWFEGKFGGEIGDLKEEEDKNFVYYRVFLPDVDKENLNVEVRDGMVSISAKTEDVKEEKREDAIAKSSYEKSFERRFPVPSDVDSEKVDFEMEGDYLVIKFPKKREELYDV